MGGAERPIRVAQCSAADFHGVGGARLQNLLRLLRLGDEPDCGGGNARATAHLFGERHLVVGLHRNGHVGNQSACGHVNQVHAVGLQNLSQFNGLVKVPTACGPVGGGDAHQHRHGVGHDGTNRIHDFDQHADAIVERSAVLVVTLVDERVEELRQQVAVRGMDFHRVEADVHGTPGGVAELVHDGVDLIDAQRARTSQGTVCVGAWANRPPSALLLRHALSIETDRVAAGGTLASGVVELHRHRGTHCLRVGHDPTPCVHLSVIPQSQIARRNAASRRDGGRFHDDHAEAAHRARNVMLVVEWRGLAVLRQCGIRVHWRQPDAVAHGDATQRHRIERFDRLVLLAVLLVFAHRHLSYESLVSPESSISAPRSHATGMVPIAL